MLLRLVTGLALCAGLAAADPGTGTGTGTDAGTTGGGAPAVDAQLTRDASYLLGREIASKIGGMVDQYGFDRAAILEGMHEALDGKPGRLDGAQAMAIMQRFQMQQQAAAQARTEREAAEAPLRKEKNAAFLAENGRKPGVKTTASGLQYEVITAGTGKAADATSRVRVNYEGRLLDGTVFDASARHGGPMTFQVGQVIQGWNEAMAMMKEGDKWRLWIPSELGYGEQGTQGGPIGPNQLLVFDVELVEVLPGQAGGHGPGDGHGH